jgi:zinc-binding alcohol dehydrogenase/oxidoreductase
MMKALVLTELAYPKCTTVEKPLQSDDSVVLKIQAAALNHRDLWITKGLYANIQFPTILGSDGVGTLDGQHFIINPNENWGTDQRYQSKQYSILGLPKNGTFAEYIHIDKDKLHLLPSYLDPISGAALPVAGLTAYRALFRRCNLKKGDTILITGIGGGVALITLQMAHAIGANVYVTSGDDTKIEKAIALGAKGGVNYKNENWAKELTLKAGGFDIIIDSAAGNAVADLIKICNRGGTICFYGGTLGTINGLSPQIIFFKQLNILGSTMGSDLDFVEMLQFVDNHKIVPIIDSIFTLDKSHQAFERMNSGKQFGKIIFEM